MNKQKKKQPTHEVAQESRVREPYPVAIWIVCSSSPLLYTIESIVGANNIAGNGSLSAKDAKSEVDESVVCIEQGWGSLLRWNGLFCT